jgi:hypothetical protein
MRTVHSRLEAVAWLVTHDALTTGFAPRGPSTNHRVTKEPEMADVLYVVLTVATFAVLALVVKGVERLER